MKRFLHLVLQVLLLAVAGVADASLQELKSFEGEGDARANEKRTVVINAHGKPEPAVLLDTEHFDDAAASRVMRKQDPDEAGYTAEDILKAGYSLKDLRKAGYTAKDLHKAGISARDLHKAGYTAKDLRKAGYTVKDLAGGEGVDDVKDNPRIRRAVHEAAGYAADYATDYGDDPEECKDDDHAQCQKNKDACDNERDMLTHCRKTCGVCKSPVKCLWEDWGDWSACDESCGIGSQVRSRDVKREAKDGGDECRGPPQESQDCNDEPCPTTTTLPPVSAATQEQVPNATAMAKPMSEKESGSNFLKYLFFGAAGLAAIGVGALVINQQNQKSNVECDEFGEPLVQDQWDQSQQEVQVVDDDGYQY